MRNGKWAAIVVLMAACGGPAVAAFVYRVDLNVPAVFGGSGDLSVSGTITLDALGEVTDANITDWQLTVRSEVGGTTVSNTISPANARLQSFFPVDTIGLSSGTQFVARFRNPFQLRFGDTGESGALVAIGRGFSDNPNEVFYNIGNSQSFAVGSIPGLVLAAVPEPSSLALAGAAAAAAYVRRRRKRAAG